MLLAGALLPLRAQRSQARSETPRVSAVAAVSPLGGDAKPSIDALKARVEVDPGDAKLHAQLGLAYLQEARNQAAPWNLPHADDALTRSLELQPRGNLEAYVGMAALANARHDFSASLEWARRAIATNPYNPAGYGLLGDALFELGRVRAADAAYQEMVEVRPDVVSYVRVSYAHQFHGRTRAALATMGLALQAAGPTGETAAWVRHQLGDIYTSLGNIRQAARQNRIGISIAPGYVPPTVGLAESYIAAGRLDEAIAIMERAASELPSLEYMITLADLYRATGRDADADRQYREVADKLRQYRRSGVLPDADFIVFYADHGLRSSAALREAITIYRERPTAKTADALAWMLHSLGRNKAAWRYAREAIGSQAANAAMYFHAGVIAAARGDGDRARALMRKALELNPVFSVIQAPIARRIAGLR